MHKFFFPVLVSGGHGEPKIKMADFLREIGHLDFLRAIVKLFDYSSLLAKCYKNQLVAAFESGLVLFAFSGSDFIG